MRYRASLIGTAAFCGLAMTATICGVFGIPGLEADDAAHVAALVAGAIGLLLGLPMLGSYLALNARVRATRAAPAGGWQVSPQDIATFREWQQRNGIVNEWRPTRTERKRGIRVCWAGEHLVVGGYYRRVAPGQYPSVYAVRSRLAAPASVALHYWQVWAHNMSSVTRLVQTDREFRFPAPDEAQAKAFSRHFNRMLEESGHARGQRLLRLSNWALGAAACFLVLLLFGFGVAWHDRHHGIFRSTPERAVLIGVTVLGVMGTPLLLWLGAVLRWNARRGGS